MKTLFALTIAVCTTGIAHAQTETLTINFASIATPVETSPYQINSLWELRLQYHLPTGVYTSTKIEVTLPDALTHPVLTLQSTSQAAGWTKVLSNPSATQQKVTFTLADNPTATTIDGVIVLTVRGEASSSLAGIRYFTRSQTPFPFVARLTGTRDGVATPFDVSASKSQAVIGTADAHWQYSLSPYRTKNDVIGTKKVFIVRYDLRAFVCGNAPLASTAQGYGIPIRVQLGSKLHFLRSWWGNNNAVWPTDEVTGSSGTVAYSPIPYGTAGHIAGGHIDANWNNTLARYSNGGCDYTNNFFVDLVFECGTTWDPTNVDYQMKVVDQDAPLLPVQLAQLNYDGTVAQSLSLAAITAANTGGVTQCGGDIVVKKSADDKASPGVSTGWTIGLTLPIGGLPSAGAIIVDRLPIDSSSTQDLIMSKSLAPFATTTVWACDLRGEPGVAYFNGAAFAGYKGAGKCQLAVNAPTAPTTYWAPPSSMSNVTHVVWALPDSYAGAADGVPTGINFQLYTHVPATQASNYTNCAQLVGTVDGKAYSDTSLEPFGTPDPPSASDDPAEDCATKTIPTFACANLQMFADDQQIKSPGACGTLYFRNLNSSIGLVLANPAMYIDLPAGIIVKDLPGGSSSSDGDGVYGSCADGTPIDGVATATPSTVGDGVHPLTETTRVNFNVYRANPTCAVNTYGFNYIVDFCLATDWPWVNGTPLTFTTNFVPGGNLGTSAQCTGYGTTTPLSVSYTLSVPPEMRAYVAPVCQSDPAGAGFVVEGLNSGGVNLPAASLAFAVPTDATFQAVEDVVRPAGSTYEGSTNGSDWVALGTLSPSSVRHVRLKGFMLPAIVANRVAFRVLVAVTGLGSVLDGVGALTVDPSIFPTAATGTGQFEVGSCTLVTLTKYHDIDNSKDQGTTEPVLRDWGFSVKTAAGIFVASGATGADGQWSVIVPKGNYVASEVIPPSTNLSWTSTSSVDWTFSVAVGAGTLTHAFGNKCGCNDHDLCTTYACERTVGEGQVASASDYACVPHAIDCGGSVCAPIVCDPAIGCTEAAFEACSPMIYFLPARDSTTNKLVAFRCEVPTDGVSPPVCDTKADGQLRVYPDQGGACSASPGVRYERTREH